MHPSPNNKTRSPTPRLDLLENFDSLTPFEKATIRQIAIPLSFGFTKSEIASELKTSTKFVDTSLAALHESLEKKTHR
jgi:DNA-binding NarL/FixJ family response regulator